MAEEEKKDITVKAPETPVTTAPEMKTHGQDSNQFKEAFDKRKQGYQNNINGALDRSLNQQKQGIMDAYNKNVLAQNQVSDSINQSYGFAKDDLTTQANRTQTGMDNWADARNLNYQPGSQQSLSLGMANRRAAGGLAQQQNMALQDNARRQAMLESDYKNRVAQAVAEGDYKKAAALFDNWNNQNSWLEKNAEAMASFGNFTGYQQLYGQPQANAMQQFWIGSNPELAYNTGVIDSARYKAITGKNPPDYVPPPGSEGTVWGDWWWQTEEGKRASGQSRAGGNNNNESAPVPGGG